MILSRWKLSKFPIIFVLIIFAKTNEISENFRNFRVTVCELLKIIHFRKYCGPNTLKQRIWKFYNYLKQKCKMQFRIFKNLEEFCCITFFVSEVSFSLSFLFKKFETIMQMILWLFTKFISHHFAQKIPSRLIYFFKSLVHDWKL